MVNDQVIVYKFTRIHPSKEGSLAVAETPTTIYIPSKPGTTKLRNTDLGLGLGIRTGRKLELRLGLTFM